MADRLYTVRVFPLVEDGRDIEEACGFARDASLAAAMEQAGHAAEKWLAANPTVEDDYGDEQAVWALDAKVEFGGGER